MKKNISVMMNDAPDYTTKHVIWNDNGNGGKAVLLVGYCPDTLSYFAGLFAEVKKAFPCAKAEEAICTKVRKSDMVNGFTMLLVPIYGKKRVVNGYKESDFSTLGIEAY